MGPMPVGALPQQAERTRKGPEALAPEPEPARREAEVPPQEPEPATKELGSQAA